MNQGCFTLNQSPFGANDSPLNGGSSSGQGFTGFSCDESADNPVEVSPTKRLTKSQVKNTVRSLLDWRLNSSTRNNIMDSIASKLEAIPSDVTTHREYDTFDVSMSILHIQSYFNLAYSLAIHLTNSMVGPNFVGSCYNNPNENCVRQFIEDVGLQVYRRPLKQSDVDFYYNTYQVDPSSGFLLTVATLLNSTRVSLSPGVGKCAR